MKRIFTIFKGFHISHIFPRFHSEKSFINFSFKFDQNCLYNLNDLNNLDINKLYGLGFGLNHHKQSFRLGWNCQSPNGKIQIHAYYYNDGIRKIEYICDVDINTEYNCYLYLDRTSNKVFVDISKDAWNINKQYVFRFKDCLRWGFFLFPYFGGDEFAPHKMSIIIRNK